VFGLFIVSQLALNAPHGSGKFLRDHLQPLPLAGLLLLVLVWTQLLRASIFTPASRREADPRLQNP
jgi:hypothetical protein